MTPFDLLLTCAPLVAPVTMAAVVQQESGGHPLTVHDNTTGMSYHLRTEAEAIALLRTLTTAGHSLDLGLGQVNSQNLPKLGLTVETIFQPCTNLSAASAILMKAWEQAGGNLRGALSAYNTGRVDSSIGASYAALVYGQAQHAPTTAPIIPAIPAIPGGKLPRWVIQGLPTTTQIQTETTAPTLVPRPVVRRKPPNAAIEHSPANSSLHPQVGDLRPNLGLGLNAANQ
jgi:type IV secretion system protein VirB1